MFVDWKGKGSISIRRKGHRSRENCKCISVRHEPQHSFVCSSTPSSSLFSKYLLGACYVLRPGFLNLMLWTLGPHDSQWRGHPVHCGRFISFPGLRLLDARSNRCPAPRCGSQSPDIARCPLVASYPQLRPTSLGHGMHHGPK